jgi:hypothetical protein
MRKIHHRYSPLKSMMKPSRQILGIVMDESYTSQLNQLMSTLYDSQMIPTFSSMPPSYKLAVGLFSPNKNIHELSLISAIRNPVVI